MKHSSSLAGPLRKIISRCPLELSIGWILSHVSLFPMSQSMQFCELQSQKWSLLWAQHPVQYLFSFSRQPSSLFQSCTNTSGPKFRFFLSKSFTTVRIPAQFAHQPRCTLLVCTNSGTAPLPHHDTAPLSLKRWPRGTQRWMVFQEKMVVAELCSFFQTHLIWWDADICMLQWKRQLIQQTAAVITPA